MRVLTSLSQVAKELGDKVRIIKVDTDKNPDLSSQLRVRQQASKQHMQASAGPRAVECVCR